MRSLLRLRLIVPVLCGIASSAPARSVRAGDEFSTPAAAVRDDGDRTPRVFLTLAPGLSNLQLLGMASFTVEVATWQVSVRALLADGLDFDLSPTESVYDYALSIGKAWHRGGRTTYLSGGMGWATTVRRGKFLYKEDEGFGTLVYEELGGHGLAFAFEAGLAWDARFGGIGLALVGDLNGQLPALGIAAILRLGKTR
ncbi:MAG TPA: hypothetical protein VGP07_19400 [Polyangia bacterium]|jgi:hypothetical protein